MRKSLPNNKSYVLWPIDNTYNMLDFWNNNYKYEIFILILLQSVILNNYEVTYMDSNNIIETNDNGIGDHDIRLGTCRFTDGHEHNRNMII